MCRNRVAIMRVRIAIVIAIGFIGQAALSATSAKLPDITPAQLIEAVKFGDSLHRNVDCKYIVDQRYNKAIHEKHGRPLTRKLEIHWRKERTKDYVDVTCYDGRLRRGKPFRFVLAHNDKIRMQWQPNDRLGYISEKPHKHAWPIPFDFCLTLKKRGKMLGQALEQSKIETLKTALWENHECYYVQAVQPDKGRAKVWIDPKASWRARSVRYWGPNGSIWYEATASLKDYGNGIWFPAEGVFKLYGRDRATGKRVVSIESRLKLEQIGLNAKLTRRDFEIQYPRGTRVYVADLDASYIAGVTSLGGFGEEALNRMASKPLPDMREFAIRSDPNQTKDRMLLVCFFDMNQRPSRNCITQLAKQAEHLKEKGIVVVAVHTSTVDESALKEWVNNNDIPFPVGMLQDDEEKTRFTWGVKALPWLILTNQEHIVIAEGFRLGDLDSQLTQGGGKTSADGA